MYCTALSRQITTPIDGYYIYEFQARRLHVCNTAPMPATVDSRAGVAGTEAISITRKAV